MKFDRKYLLAFFPLAFLFIAFWFFSDIVSYIILAWVLSMIGAPLMGLFRKILPRNTAAVVTLFSFLLILIFLFWVFIPPIVQQTRNLAGVDYEQLVSSLEEPMSDWNQWLVRKGFIEENNLTTDVDTLSEYDKEKEIIARWIRTDTLPGLSDETGNIPPFALLLHVDAGNQQNDGAVEKKIDETGNLTFFEQLRQNIVDFLDPSVVQRVLGSMVGFFGNLLIAILSIFFIAFFFLREQGLFIQMLAAIVPNEYEEQVVRAVDDLSNLLVRYFVGIAFQVTIITIFVSIVLKILGIKNALLIGFFAALMNVIPYLGPIVGATFGVIITVSSNLDVPFYSELLPMLSKVVVVFMIMQLIDNFLLQPNIFSKSVKAHPLEIFIVILIAANIAGILGMVLAIPVYTVLRVVARVFLSEFKLVKRITEGM